MAHYFLINKNTNIVDNCISWNGDTSTWQPPETHIAVPAETTPAIDWVWDAAAQDCVAVEGVGNGGIGDVWDGQKLIAVKPTQPPEVAE